MGLRPGEASSREATSADEAVQCYALDTDDGTYERADIGVEDTDGTWMRYRVTYHRKTSVTLGRPRDVDDPRASEE